MISLECQPCFCATLRKVVRVRSSSVNFFNILTTSLKCCLIKWFQFQNCSKTAENNQNSRFSPKFEIFAQTRDFRSKRSKMFSRSRRAADLSRSRRRSRRHGGRRASAAAAAMAATKILFLRFPLANIKETSLLGPTFEVFRDSLSK